jgi:serine/threonine protein kinase
MTQNELTQMGDSFEESNSYSPPSVVIDPRQVSWGRLIAEEGEGRFELTPRDPKHRYPQPPLESSELSHFLGCLHVHKSDRFNEFSLGRNSKMDIVPPKPSKRLGDDYNIHEWAHSMVSNKHCTVYCMLSKTGGGMDVFVEDSSGNGTIVNGTILLKRGETRLIHTGDEICLVNPHPLRKKIRNPDVIQAVQRRYTYIFINVFQQQQALNSGKRKRLMPPPSSVKRRTGLVDPRNMVHHSLEPPNTSPKAAIHSRTKACTGTVDKRVEQFYDIRDTLGTGTCGEVKRAISRQTGKEFAVKIIQLGGRNRGALLSDQESAALKAEASILQALDHPYIVKLHDVFVHPNDAIYLVMELMSGGDLFDRIVQKSRYTEVESRRTMRRLLNAVYYLHEKKSLVHRDLKPENILCMSRSNDVGVKLTDFGLAKSVTQEGLKTFCGTPQYFAPEVLRRNYTISGQGRYGRKADMWSLGVILYILLSGMPPFDVSQGFEALGDFQIKFPESCWKGVSSSARDLVRQLLMTDPNKRLSVVGACEHPWILMKDGDTHTNPLDDPAAPMREKQETPSNKFSEKDVSAEFVNSVIQVTKSQVTPDETSPTKEVNEHVLVTSQITPPHHNPVQLPENLNSRGNQFRDIVLKSAEKADEKKESHDSQTSTLVSVRSTAPSSIAVKLEPRPTELTDDEICSHFSDESRSSFSDCTVSTKGELGRNASNSSNTSDDHPTKDVISEKENKPADLNRHSTFRQTNRKVDNARTPKRKGAAQSGVDSSQSKQQTTLNNWFQKKGDIAT